MTYISANRIFRFLFLFFIFAASVPGETLYSGNRKYEKRDGAWYQCDPAGDYRVNSRLISVRFKPGITESEIERLNASIGVAVLRKNSRGIYDLDLRGLDPLEAADRLRKSALVKTADIQTIGRVFSRPNDEYFSLQEHLSQPASNDDIQVVEGWEIETGKGIVLAVIDTGIDVNHPDLRRNLWINTGETPNNGIDDDGNGYVDDYNGYHLVYDSPDLTRGITLESVYQNGIWIYGEGYHGTKVSGIAAAETNNILGVAGVAGGWNGTGGSRIMMLGGADSLGATYTESIREAIYYAVDNGARVISLSLGCGDSNEMVAAVDSAAARGIVMVAASGYTNNTMLPFPARHPQVMAVGAIGRNNRKITHSTYGREVDALDVVAPSGETLQETPVYTTFPTGYRGSNGYARSSQTSSAAPQAAGLACLLLSLNPALTPGQVHEIICRTTDKVGGSDYSDWPEAPYGAWDDSLGYGRINVYKALFAARGFGHITTNTTWYADQRLTGEVTVDAGKTLRIGKEVTVEFAKGKKLIVYGTLVADRGATFTGPGEGNFWSGIDLKPGGKLETTGEITIENADTGIDIANSDGLVNGNNRITIRNCRQAGIWVTGCSPTIRNVLCDRVSCSNCENGGITVSGNGSNPIIIATTVRNSIIGLKISGTDCSARVDSCVFDSSNAESSIVLSSHCGIDLDGDNIIVPRTGKMAISSYQDSRYPIHAENNWWGSADPDWKKLFTWPDSIIHRDANRDSLSSSPSGSPLPVPASLTSAGSLPQGKEYVAVSPNPANPSTLITFFISRPSQVRLTIYSATGQKVATLVDGFLGAGVHSVRFDGADYASGLYLWSFESAGMRKTGKMMVVR